MSVFFSRTPNTGQQRTIFRIDEGTRVTTSEPQTYKDIDWVSLHTNARSRKGWKMKGPCDWDAKAKSFSSRNKDAVYADLFIAQLPLQRDHTVLDIGCGPGTLALPIAQAVKQVTALDFSSGMLDSLKESAISAGLDNIKTVKCAWEDDWSAREISPHDIVICSRSMGVKDLRGALQKANAYARQYVFLSDRIGPTPFEVGAFAALNRPFSTGPDYIYTVNMLYSMRIYANITVLNLPRDTVYDSMDQALAAYSWMFQDTTDNDLQTLQKYITKHTIAKKGDQLTVRRETPPQWALIWWQKPQL